MMLVPFTFILILVVPLVLVGLILLIIKKPRLALIILGTLVLFPVAFIMVMMLLKFFGGAVAGVPRVDLSMSVLVFPLIFALVVGFIYLLVKYPKAGLITLGVVVLAVLGFLGLFMSHKVVYVSERSAQHHAVATVVEAKNGHSENIIRNEEELTAIWREGIEDEFQVDVYPSQKAAARALGKQLVELATKLEDGKEPEWFVINPKHSRVDKEILGELSKAIEEYKGNDNPILSEASSTLSREANVTLKMIQFTPDSPDSPIQSGTFEARVSVNSKKSTITLQFSEKPWLENFSAYCNSNPGRQYVVVRSKSSCTNENQARREVKTAATRVLVWKLHDMGVSSSVDFGDIEKHGFIADKFVQSLRGNTQIFRQAILLDVSGDNMNKLFRDKQRNMAETVKTLAYAKSKKVTTWVRMLISLAGLITVICVVYLIVNVATKGYYTLVLRIVTAAAIIIGAIVLSLVLFGIRI
jgi:xanthosine utilization system XapX-like protein